MAEDRAVEMQRFARLNAVETEAALRDVLNWEHQIKTKDVELRTLQAVTENTLPPVRNRSKGARDASIEPAAAVPAPLPTPAAVAPSTAAQPSRIKGGDYNAWAKFVANELESVEKAIDAPVPLISAADLPAAALTAAASTENPEEKLRRTKAALEREKGNVHFKEGKHAAAVACYTRGMALDPSDALLPANRAMANLKLKRYADAEKDCCAALVIDPKNVKAWSRRGTARRELQHFALALEDFRKVLTFEPKSAETKKHVKELEEILAKAKDAEYRQFNPLQAAAVRAAATTGAHAVGKATVPPALEMSGMRRISIEEIGSSASDSNDDDDDDDSSTSTRKATAPITNTTTTDGVAARSVVQPRPAKGRPANGNLVVEVEKPTQGSGVTPIASTPSIMAAAVTLSPLPSLTAKKEASAVAVAPRLPTALSTPPKNNIEFERAWRSANGNIGLLTAFVQILNVQTLPLLFKSGVEPSLFTQLVHVLHALGPSHAVLQLAVLNAIAGAKRVDTAVMFLDPPDKAMLGTVVRLAVEGAGATPEVAKKLRSTFKIIP